MTIKEKTMIIIKNQKNSKPLNILIIIILIILIINILNLIQKIDTDTQYTYTSYIQNNSIVNGTFVGDVMLGRSIEQIANTEGYEYLFENAKHLWENSDYVSCNFESAILNNPDNFNQSARERYIYSKTASLDALKNVGFNLVSLANNHVGDYERKGIANAITALENRNIEYVGIGENIEEAKKYNIKEINGVKIATIAITDKFYQNDIATEDSCGVLSTAYTDYPTLVAEAKQNADVVIVNIHWGEEYTKYILEEQEEIAKNLIDAGADIIVGSHQHTLQSIEKYNDGIIFYGLGNFVFDQGWTFSKEGILVNFSIDNEGNLAFEVIPILLEDARPSVATDLYHTTRIFNTLTDRLNENDYEIVDNRLIIRNLKVQIQTTEESSSDTSENTNQEITGEIIEDITQETTQNINENHTNNSIN